MRFTLLMALATLPSLANAQTSAAQVAVREIRAELDAPALGNEGARDAIRIEAGSDSSSVSIKASTKLDNGTGATRTLSLIASAPLGKTDNDATLATQHGLAANTTLALAFAYTSISGIRVPGEETLDLCERPNGFRSLFVGIPGNKGEDFNCDTGTVKQLAEQGKISWATYRAFRSAFFGPDAAIHSLGLRLFGGYRDANYFDSATLEQTKERNNTGGLAVTYSYTPLEATQLFAASFGIQSVYKDAKASTACLPAPPPGSTLLTCANGSIGAPKKQTTQTLDLEWRRKVLERFAFSLQLGRDFKDKVTSIQLPLYIVGNDKDGLNGGLRLGWASDDKKVSIGVFVGKAFSVQP